LFTTFRLCSRCISLYSRCPPVRVRCAPVAVDCLLTAPSPRFPDRFPDSSRLVNLLPDGGLAAAVTLLAMLSHTVTSPFASSAPPQLRGVAEVARIRQHSTLTSSATTPAVIVREPKTLPADMNGDRQVIRLT